MRRRGFSAVLLTTAAWFFAFTAEDWGDHPHRSWPHHLVVGAVLALLVGPAFTGYRRWRDRHAPERPGLTDDDRQHLRNGTVPSDPDERRALVAFARQQRYDAVPSDGRMLLLLCAAGLLIWWAFSEASTARVVVAAILLPVMAMNALRAHRGEKRLARLEGQLGLDPGRLESPGPGARSSVAAPRDENP